MTLLHVAQPARGPDLRLLERHVDLGACGLLLRGRGSVCAVAVRAVSVRADALRAVGVCAVFGDDDRRGDRGTAAAQQLQLLRHERKLLRHDVLQSPLRRGGHGGRRRGG